MTREDQFEAFWRAYPRRIGKGAARRSFIRAIGKTTLENMLRAIADYIANKPSYQDFKHPSTWLNQECWDDEWTAPSPIRIQARQTPFQQRHQAAINAFERDLGTSTNDQFASDIDLEPANWRTH